MFESDRDSSNNAEEDKISLKERTHRNFDDMYLSDIVKLREREGKRVDLGRSPKGHL